MSTRALPGHATTRPATAPPVAPPALDLPTDFVTGASPAPFGARLETTLTPELSARLRVLAGTHDADVHTVLVAATQVLLHRYSGQDDVVLGAAEAPRVAGPDAAAVDHLTPPRPVHVSLDDDPSFVELLDRTCAAMTATPAQSLDATTSPSRLAASAPIVAPLRVVVAMRDARPRSARRSCTRSARPT